MTFVAHHAANFETRLTGQFRQPGGVVELATATGEAHVDVDQNLSDAAGHCCFDGGDGVDGHGDTSTVCDEPSQPSGVEHLVGEQKVVTEPGSHHALDLADGGAREPMVSEFVLEPGQLGALVGLHMWAQLAARQVRGHGAEIAVEQSRVDDQCRGLQLLDVAGDWHRSSCLAVRCNVAQPSLSVAFTCRCVRYVG